MNQSARVYVVRFSEMKSFIIDCMRSVGVNSDHAEQLADLLTVADQRGHYSHGLNRLRVYIEDVKSGICNGNGSPKILKQKGATAWVDGDNALGVVVGNFCTDLAVNLAKEHGIGWVVAKGSNHFGIAGYYPLRMAHEHGFIGMAFTNASPLVFPTRSIEIGLGTNPLSCVAQAKNGDEFALDMAMSTVALGKIEWAQTKGAKTIPAQWAADKSGTPTTNPSSVAGLLPLGGSEETSGYKGTGLAMMTELFCGILGGSHFGKNIRNWRELSKVADLGQCFVALDPDCFSPGFADRLQQFLGETRGLKQANPELPVLVAGDPERENMAKCERLGGLFYPCIDHLEQIAKQCSVKLFNFEVLEV